MARPKAEPPALVVPESAQISATSYNPTDAQKRYVSLLVNGYSPQTARKKLRISLETFWAWGMTPGFSPWVDSVLRAETANEIGLVRQALKQAALDGNPAAAKAFLEAYDPEFSQRKQLSRGKNKGPTRQQNYFFMVGDVAPDPLSVKPAKVKIS